MKLAIDSLLDSLPGVEDIAEGEYRDRVEELQETYELALAFKHTFSTSNGKRVLQYLKSKTVDTTTWDPNLDYKKAIALGFTREGQNSIYRHIIEMIDSVEDLQKRLTQLTRSSEDEQQPE